MSTDPRHRPWTPPEDAYLRGCCDIGRTLGLAPAVVLRCACQALDRPRAAVRARIALLQLWTREEAR